MSATTAEAAPRRAAWYAFLAGELAPRPGRMRAVARMTAGCVLVVAVAMLFEIPLPAYMAYIVFLVSRGEAAATLMTAVAGGLAATCAVALSLLFYMLDAGEPSLRLPLLALSTFLAMFFARTSALGPIAFLGGFVLVLSQTLIDDMPSLEFLTRFLLWLWVVVMVPAAITVLFDLLWGDDPAALLRQRVQSMLGAMVDHLEGRGPADLVALHDEAVETIELHAHAALWHRRIKIRTAVDLRLFEAVATFASLLRLLPAETRASVRQVLAAAVDAARAALLAGSTPSIQRCAIDTATLDDGSRPVALALAKTADQLLQGAADRLDATPPPAAPRALFVPDAFRNPGHARYALKVTLAVVLAYAIYSLLDWPGIRTDITTCFFVALGSMAETMHKLSLRLAGAMIGGLLAGLCIVFVLPLMTDIGELSLLIAVVSAACAWVATSSERLAYAGMQLAFAFYLGVLHDYAPATDLTTMRDRVVGIVLGNLLISAIFSSLWPVSAQQVVRGAMATALDALASALDSAGKDAHAARLAVAQALTKARKLAELAWLERGWLSSRATMQPVGAWTLEEVDRLAAAVLVVQGQAPTVAAGQRDAMMASWFAEAATRLRRGELAPPPPVVWPEPDAGRQEAWTRLNREIAHVASQR